MTPSSVGRPREFDEAQVLEQVLHLFWERGYASTSIADLMEVTQLTKGSLYKAYGDKRSLFLLVLQRYLEDGRARLHQVLEEAESPKAGVQEWMMRMARMATRGRLRKGCFGVNTCAEVAPHDPGVRELLRSHHRQVEAEFEKALTADRDALAPGVEPKDAARMLRTLIGGLQVDGKASMDGTHAETTVRLALRGVFGADGLQEGMSKK